MRSSGFDSSLQRLQEMILQSTNLDDFLDGLTAIGVEAVASAVGCPVDCSITLRRRKRALAVGANCAEARNVEEAEAELGEGPCLDALDRNEIVVLNDAAHDHRWPRLTEAMALNGYAAAIGMPLDIGSEAQAAINFFAAVPDAFGPEAVQAAESFASLASTSLQLAVRIGAEKLLAEDLRAAMVNRAAIDMACGAIMAQNRCSQEEAFNILVRASNNRNQKLHAVAEEFLRKVSDRRGRGGGNGGHRRAGG
ncbi:GAF and ANTAR domain-containing protein [Arthrobacter sp. M4]|uniref:GAF and ANTAR domain-containing protein n=1 Tax=Arthrobacter sp. M4 TaxID=218160 RepID=UPI001CDC7252|nr:GAF and ANTAR domain-containing protein [Arthrobacter sp. M4]MCA4135172.1 GAF and ANTAR domain-containing protein [Arthrobacter sp. M4]